MYLRDRGIATLPLAVINTALDPMGFVIQARKARDAKRFVACIDKDGRVEQYGLFELRSTAEERE